MTWHDQQPLYRCLLDHFGPQHWWPAQSPFEMMVGAILTQNTAWRNVELSIAQLVAAEALSPQGMMRLEPEALQALIRSSGFFRQKARALRALATEIVTHHGGDPLILVGGELTAVRQRLLNLPGIGPETADCILLYAGQQPIFVVDAYTRRIFGRLGLLHGNESYAAVQTLFMRHLPAEAPLFNEYHALLVALAKACCRRRQPRCGHCPLLLRCPTGQEATSF